MLNFSCIRAVVISLTILCCTKPAGVPEDAKYYSDLNVYSLSEHSSEGLKVSTWNRDGRLESVVQSSSTKIERRSYVDGLLSMTTTTDKVKGLVEKIQYDKNGEWVGHYILTLDGEKLKDMDKIVITKDLYYVRIRDYSTGYEEEVSYNDGKKQYSQKKRIGAESAGE